MSKKSFKIIAQFLILLGLCLFVSIICGVVIYLTIIGFRAMDVAIRIIVAIIVLLIWVLSIRIILRIGHFKNLLFEFNNSILFHRNSYERDISTRYNLLKVKYPLAIAEFEKVCWKDRSLLSNYEIFEQALSISEQDWIEKERLVENTLKD